MLKLKLSPVVMSLLLGFVTFPLMAYSQEANFGQIKLARGFDRTEATVIGNTGGTFSLGDIAKRDQNGKNCIGFGSQVPDHIMVLEEDMQNLTLSVNSGGKDTTLLIQGPNKQTILCGDDGNSGKDAMIENSQWKAGTYKIWVGSLDAGQRWRYRLSIQ